MSNFRKHLVKKGTVIRKALSFLNDLAADAILFVVDENDKLIGSLTDGDIRRSLINGGDIDDIVENIIQPNPKFFRSGDYTIEQVREYKSKNFKVIPVLDIEDRIINVINFRFLKSYLPLDAVIMAGGRGTRLRPMTDSVPKPLLKVADKPIIEHNVDRLAQFGIDDIWLSLRYLGEQIQSYFGNGSAKELNINYVWETDPLGTIGSVSKIQGFKHDHILITNSDLLTNIDYEDFFTEFIERDADLAVLTIPYEVKVPYAVLEIGQNKVVDFKEKPTYTYYSNGGVYLVKKSILDHIPQNTFYNATDLMETLIKQGKNVISYTSSGYWLDIGNPSDYERAQNDFHKIKF